MTRLTTTLIVLWFAATLVGQIRAQPPAAPPATAEVLCAACHTCTEPAPELLCLRGCTRAAAAATEEEFRARVPDVVILDELEDLYLPVPFDHEGHAEMAKMTLGCTVCHHFTPEGAAHPACKNCHEVAPVREDMRKPGLKGAYHRQCMACHREWSHETACEACHQPKAGRGSEAGTLPPTKDDIVGRMHPPIPEPEISTYDTRYKHVPGTKVTFRHKEHIHRFGFSCAECHREDSCSRCHEEGKSHAEQPKTLEEHHNPCAHCHDMEAPEKCDHCHWGGDVPEPSRFDHASTGWPLGRYHEDKGCRACHIAVRFAKLDRTCSSCHGDWNPNNFDHRVTGQSLDENHVETDCEDCHADRVFDRRPTCNECHEEDEGIVFPAKRPGSVVTQPGHEKE